MTLLLDYLWLYEVIFCVDDISSLVSSWASSAFIREHRQPEGTPERENGG